MPEKGVIPSFPKLFFGGFPLFETLSEVCQVPSAQPKMVDRPGAEWLRLPSRAARGARRFGFSSSLPPPKRGLGEQID